MNWDDYYQNIPLDQIPWNNLNPQFLDNLFERFNLHKSGTVLDVGCGPGQKSVYLAKKGYQVFGIDISANAIKLAKSTTSVVNFSVCDIAFDALPKVNFDIVIDLLVSQFLTTEELSKFITKLIKLLNKNSFYILAAFVSDTTRVDAPDWVKQISRSEKEIIKIYSVFKLVGVFYKQGQKGKIGYFIFQY